MRNEKKFKTELVNACINNDIETFFNKYIKPQYHCTDYEYLNKVEASLLIRIWMNEQYVEVSDSKTFPCSDCQYSERTCLELPCKICKYAWKNQYEEVEKQEHNRCDGCTYENLDAKLYPCNQCKVSYEDRYRLPYGKIDPKKMEVKEDDK